MKKRFDCSRLPWTLEGAAPYLWAFERLHHMGPSMEVGPIPARVPGSVQAALRQAGLLPDWHVSGNSRLCEWVEHRHWIFRTSLPDDWLRGAGRFELHCEGLDYSGWVLLNGRAAGEFKGTHVPHVFDLTPLRRAENNVLEIVFDLPPRWLGQLGRTSQMTEWKPRFNYTWDWVPRLVQIGISGPVALERKEGPVWTGWRCRADADASGQGVLHLQATAEGADGGRARVWLGRDGATVREEIVPLSVLAGGMMWRDLPVELWWPNVEGGQPLYEITCCLVGADGAVHDERSARVGFRRVEWRACEGAPRGADPWVCVVNGRPVFLQGVNFPPLRAFFADTPPEAYRERLETYREMGCNLLRINACGFLETETFYDLCDELGLMVWQEFPLTSSGLENWPPEDAASIEEVARIARSFIERRGHHASLVLWSGGNELMGALDGSKEGIGKPCDLSHPMLRRLAEVAAMHDPGRRFIPCSPTGPRAHSDPTQCGKGLHWNVHGPYGWLGSPQEARAWYEKDDALFRAEMCCPGAAPADLIRQYAGTCRPWPPTAANPYWRTPTAWWLDYEKLVAMHGREPSDLEEYVEWSQAYQAEVLAIGMTACKARFPRCGGVLLWCGHDTFPLPINTSILDYEGHPKPAALVLKKIWRTRPDELVSGADIRRGADTGTNR